MREKIFGKALSEMPRGPTVEIALFTQTLVLCILLMGVVQLLNLVFFTSSLVFGSQTCSSFSF